MHICACLNDHVFKISLVFRDFCLFDHFFLFRNFLTDRANSSIILHFVSIPKTTITAVIFTFHDFFATEHFRNRALW